MAFKPTFCIIIIIIIIIIIVVLFAYNSTQFSAASSEYDEEYLQTGTTLFRLFDADDDDVYLRTDCKIPLWIGRPVLGIDLGTSYSRVGLCQSTSVYEKECHVEIIADDQGNRAIPSWVAFTDNGTLIGEAAKNQSDSNPERTIFNVQRLIGRKFDDPQVQEDVKTLPYKVVNKDGRPYIEVKIRDGETKAFSPEEISAMILRKLKEMAESYLGEGIQNAAIIVPDYFNESQRLATKIAGAIAGFNVACVIKRPTHLLIDNPVNPDEAAAYEAAVWGWSICDTTGLGFSSTFSLSGLSIGIETGGGIMKKLIQTNTFIPTWRSHVFSTYRDNQTTVLIKVYAGERALTRDCIELGSFELSGIPPAPRGVPQIEVGIGIDPYYFIQATAQDKTTNKSISITLPNEATWLTLDYDFLDKIREAVVFAVEDREVKEKIKERYKLEAFDITNAITDGGEFDDVIESDDNKRIEDTSREGNEWLDCNQNADMDEGKMKDLENVCSPIAKKVQEKDRAESSDLQIEEDSKDEL